MTDTPRPTAGGLTWDQCLSVAYEGCAEVLAKRVQELERDLAAAESRGYVRGMREAVEAAEAEVMGWRNIHSIMPSNVATASAMSAVALLRDRLTARLKEAER